MGVVVAGGVVFGGGLVVGRVVGPGFDVVVPGGLVSSGGRGGVVFTEPGGGTSVTVGWPSGPVVTVALDDEEDDEEVAALDELGSSSATVSDSLSGTLLEGRICWEPAVLSLPPPTPEAVFTGPTSWAMPPKAVASTTPLIASRR